MPFKDRESKKQAQARWYRQVVKPRRINWIKQHGPCKRCGSWNNLEVDHIDKTKKISHKVWTWSEVRRNEELKKCQVLCTTCHDIKTNEEFDEGFVVHGDYCRGYQNGCRCSECITANTIAKRAQDFKNGRGTDHRKRIGVLGEPARPRLPVTQETTG